MPRVYSTKTTESKGTSVAPFQYRGQEARFVKSVSPKPNNTQLFMAQPSYTGTKSNISTYIKLTKSYAYLYCCKNRKLHT